MDKTKSTSARKRAIETLAGAAWEYTEGEHWNGWNGGHGVEYADLWRKTAARVLTAVPLRELLVLGADVRADVPIIAQLAMGYHTTERGSTAADFPDRDSIALARYLWGRADVRKDLLRFAKLA